MKDRIEALTAEHARQLEQQRSWVLGHYAAACRQQYDTVEGKLRLIEVILGSGWITPDETLKLQCLGVTLGDAVAQRMGLHWITIEDEHGCDPALIDAPGTVVLFPMAAISRRVERDETIEVRGLFDWFCGQAIVLRSRLAASSG